MALDRDCQLSTVWGQLQPSPGAGEQRRSQCPRGARAPRGPRVPRAARRRPL